LPPQILRRLSLAHVIPEPVEKRAAPLLRVDVHTEGQTLAAAVDGSTA